MDWIEVIIFAAVVLFGLLAGDKRKKTRTQQPARPRPPSSPNRTGAVERPPALDDPQTIAEQILERLRLDAETPQRPERDSTLEPMHTSEAISLETELPAWYARADQPREIHTRESNANRNLTIETLEGAGAASHQRFRDRYVTALPEVLPMATPVASVRGTTARAREAFVLMAVFGPPKGLQ